MKTKKFFLTLFLILSSSLSIAGQVNSEKNWEITISRTSDRYHQFGERFTVRSDGEIVYFNKAKNYSASERIGEEKIGEIGKLLKLLDLPKAKAIPMGEFNLCIGSLHLPIQSFTLKQNDKSYTLTHCNRVTEESKYDFTLILSNTEKVTYKALREKIIALFGDEIRKRAENNKPL